MSDKGLDRAQGFSTAAMALIGLWITISPPQYRAQTIAIWVVFLALVSLSMRAIWEQSQRREAASAKAAAEAERVRIVLERTHSIAVDVQRKIAGTLPPPQLAVSYDPEDPTCRHADDLETEVRIRIYNSPTAGHAEKVRAVLGPLSPAYRDGLVGSAFEPLLHEDEWISMPPGATEYVRLFHHWQLPPFHVADGPSQFFLFVGGRVPIEVPTIRFSVLVQCQTAAPVSVDINVEFSEAGPLVSFPAVLDAPDA